MDLNIEMGVLLKDKAIGEQIDNLFNNIRNVCAISPEFPQNKKNNEMGLQKDKQAAIHACYALYHFREH